MNMNNIHKSMNFINQINKYSKYWKNIPNLFPNYITVSINRSNLNNDIFKSSFVSYFLTNEQSDSMLLDILFTIQEYHYDFSFRRSCREGICGSCSMNINGKNTLACIFNIKNNTSKKSIFTDIKYNHIIVNPLPHMPIVKDLVISLNHFYNQYNSIMPYRIINKENNMIQELNITKKKDRALIDGIYECILCACCSTSCPSYWWNEQVYLGPAILLQAYKWIVDPNDDTVLSRLNYLKDEDKLYKCHTIMNCSLTCPKHLKPAESIMQIKQFISKVNIITKNKHLVNYLN